MQSADGRVGIMMPGAEAIQLIKLHGVNPAAYLEDVLTRLVVGHLNSRLDELTPWVWKAASP